MATSPALALGERKTKADAIPYARHEVRPEDLRAVERALRSGRIAQGPEAERFERELAERVGVKRAVVVSSGTAALELVLRALGVGPGDEVIVPSLTFVATASAVEHCGARPIFADVEPAHLTLDPESVRRRVGPRTRGVVAMHYAGHPCDVSALAEAVGPDRFVVEDACHALGARVGAHAAGSLGRAGCFSFHPAKHITTGEGGAVTTDDSLLAERIARLREHGIERDPCRFRGLGLPASEAAEEHGPWVYEVHALGHNVRMPEASAALGRSQLARLPRYLEARRRIAETYARELGDLDGLELPHERAGFCSAWHLYPLRIRREALRIGRAELFRRLRRQGVGVQVHYVPVHLQPYYRRRLGTRWGDLPVTEGEYLRLLSLPLHAAFLPGELEHVITVVRKEFERARR